jgi:pyruvate dehydrogenase (quinone)
MNNGDLNMVTWEMRVMAGDTRYEASQDLPAFNYAAFADLIGLRGIRVETPDAIAPALDQAFLSDRPVVVDVVVDPNVPPLPPHITFEQAKSFMMSVVKGDPERGGYIRQALENMFPSLAQKP